MGSVVLGLDNVASLAGPCDKPALWQRMEDLGFVLYPLGRQRGPGPDGALTPWGTGSRAINFIDGTYFEMMGVEEEGKPDGGYGERIRALGLHLAKVQLKLHDAAAEVAQLREQGYTVGDPRYFERHFEGADGRPCVAKFKLFRYPPDETAGLQFTGAEHLTPEVTWQPGWLSHPNGASGIVAAEIEVAEPQASAARIAALLRAVVTTSSAGPDVVLQDGSAIRVRATTTDTRGAAITAAMFATLEAFDVRIGSFRLEGCR
jgi:hypothetical protein